MFCTMYMQHFQPGLSVHQLDQFHISCAWTRLVDGEDLLQAIALAAHVGHGGALVETTPFDRRVVGSNLALAAM